MSYILPETSQEYVAHIWLLPCRHLLRIVFLISTNLVTTHLYVFPFSKSCQIFHSFYPCGIMSFSILKPIHWILNELLGIKWISYRRKSFHLLRYFCKDQKFPGKEFLLTFYFLSSPTQWQVVFIFTFLSTLFQKCYFTWSWHVLLYHRYGDRSICPQFTVKLMGMTRQLF